MNSGPRSVRRQQRRAVLAAWRAVPLRRRLEVTKWAKAGRRHPDEEAVRAAQEFAVFCLHPGGDRTRSPRVRRLAVWAALPLGLVLAAEALLLRRLDSPTVVVVTFFGVAIATVVYGIFWIDLLRESRRLLALPGAGAVPAQGADASKT